MTVLNLALLNVHAGNSPNVRVVLKKLDRVVLWVYDLCIKLSNQLDFWIYNAITLLGETISVSRVEAP